jgi:hypothetical protein
LHVNPDSLSITWDSRAQKYLGRFAIFTRRLRANDERAWRNDGHAGHHRRFLANACPEPDFRYRSKASAFIWSENAMYVTRRHGRNFEVWGDLPVS